MIDIHCHLLPGVDDGCRTIEESISLIKKAISIGITDIVLTSHYAPLRGYVKSHEEILETFHHLEQVVKEQNLKVNLYLGREIDEVEGIDTLLKEGKIETLNNTDYVLVDFGMNKTDIDEYCYELIIAGYKPIIAHPERYNYVKPDDFHKWKKTGALIQINATSVFRNKNKDAKKLVKYLLKNNLVDLVGSDTHRNEINYDEYQKVVTLIEKKYKGINLSKAQDIIKSKGVS